MDDGVFQWDDDKATLNAAKHAVTFETARRAFGDPFAIDWLDDREDYGEERHCLLGIVNERLIFVAFTIRGRSRRIITARSAASHERRRYHEQNRD